MKAVRWHEPSATNHWWYALNWFRMLNQEYSPKVSNRSHIRGNGCPSGIDFWLSRWQSMQRRSVPYSLHTHTSRAEKEDLELTIHPFTRRSWIYSLTSLSSSFVMDVYLLWTGMSSFKFITMCRLGWQPMSFASLAKAPDSSNSILLAISCCSACKWMRFISGCYRDGIGPGGWEDNSLAVAVGIGSLRQSTSTILSMCCRVPKAVVRGRVCLVLLPTAIVTRGFVGLRICNRPAPTSSCSKGWLSSAASNTYEHLTVC